MFALPIPVFRAKEKSECSSRRAGSGLPGRPWFKHLIYAPGSYTGYGVKTIPGVREAIEMKRWKEAESEIVRVAAALQNEANVIESAALDIENALQVK